MKLRCVLLILAIGIPAVQCCSSTCVAQWRVFNQPTQKPLRLLGHGWSAGYHWRNPGHDSSYYNPYSHHNSARMSDWNSGVVSSGYSTGSSIDHIHTEPTPVSPNIPAIEAEFRPSNQNETEESPASEESPSSTTVDPAKIENGSKPGDGKSASGEKKSDLEKQLPFEID